MHSTPMASRRSFMQFAAAGALAYGMPGKTLAHAMLGAIRPPLSLPSIPLQCHDGSTRSLSQILHGNVTAMQFMFTGCSQTCALQGALFAAVQQRLSGQPGSQIQLLSLSIDPLGDDPRTLAAWLQRFGAKPGWRAAVPDINGLDRLRERLRQTRDGRDNHTGQVFFLNRKELLVWTTEDLPPVDTVVRQLQNIARA